MLVDTSVTPAAARALVAQIKDELTPKPIKYVFNSHYHFDHAHGNQIFGDDVEIIGHEYVRRMHLSNVLQQRTNRSFTDVLPGQIAQLKQRIAQATDAKERAGLEAQPRRHRGAHEGDQEVAVKPPNVTFTDSMALYKGGREVQLLLPRPRPHRRRHDGVPPGGADHRSPATSSRGVRAAACSRTWAIHSSTSGRPASNASRRSTSTSSSRGMARRCASEADRGLPELPARLLAPGRRAADAGRNRGAGGREIDLSKLRRSTARGSPTRTRAPCCGRTSCCRFRCRCSHDVERRERRARVLLGLKNPRPECSALKLAGHSGQPMSIVAGHRAIPVPDRAVQW